MRAECRAGAAAIGITLLLALLAPSRARAQASQAQLYQIYNSSSTPAHYKQVIAKLLGIPNALAAAPGGTGLSANALAPQNAPSNTVDTIQAACNPLRPSCQPLVFRNVPANARLRLYSLTGSLIKDLTADGTGTAIWDGTNQGGQPAASGVYFVFVQGAGQSKTIRIAVER